MKPFWGLISSYFIILPFCFSQAKEFSSSKSIDSPLNVLFVGGTFEYSAVNSQFKVFEESKYSERPGNSFSIGGSVGYKLSNLNSIKSGIRLKYVELYYDEAMSKIYDENSGIMNADGSITINYTFNPNTTLGNINVASNVTFLKPANSNFYVDGDEVRFGFASLNTYKALNIPVIFQHRFNSKPFSFFIQFGIEAEYIIDAAMDITKTRQLGLRIVDRRQLINPSSGHITWNVDIDNFTAAESFDSDLRKSNASLMGSLGMSYQPKPRYSLEFGLKFKNGITSIRKSEPVYMRSVDLGIGINWFF